MVNKNHIHVKLQDAYVAEAAAMGNASSTPNN
jgi:hypothetical protein